MGTSTSNNGPSNNTPLLPSWADPVENPTDSAPPSPDSDGEEEDENQPTPKVDESKPPRVEIPLSGKWKPAKDSLSKFVKNPSSSNFRSAAKSYVRNGGGAKGISKSIISGKKTGVRLGSLLFSFSNNGVGNTFREYFKLDFDGLSLESAINKIVDFLSPHDGTVEDSITTDAVTEALYEIYKDFDLSNKDLSVLDNITNENIKDILTSYASSYIYSKWINEIGIVLENKEISETQIVKIERQMKEFIKDSIKLEFSEIDFKNESTFEKNEIKRIMDDVFETAYQSLEEL